MCYAMYWLIQFPFMLVPPQIIRHLFTVKAVVVPLAWMAILVWAMIKAPAKISLTSNGSSLSTSSLRWAWLSSLNSALGSYATVAINIPDFTVRLVCFCHKHGLMTFMQRYAKNERVYVDQSI
jgi:NCS1 family nucleobase:cation symporter-1